MSILVVALDFSSESDALSLASRLATALKGKPLWAKVGLELFTSVGPSIVGRLKDMGLSVFLDMKLHDIPHTVQKAVASAVGCGADMMNIHVCGGKRMALAAREGIAEGTEKYARAERPLLLGVTVLTSIGPEDTDALGLLPLAHEEDARRIIPAEIAFLRATHAKEWGLDGVVCSGHETKKIKETLGSSFLCLTPGIRPFVGERPDDQRRIMTPGEAVRAGSDFLVVGRPITQAGDPVGMARLIMEEMARANDALNYC